MVGNNYCSDNYKWLKNHGLMEESWFVYRRKEIDGWKEQKTRKTLCKNNKQMELDMYKNGSSVASL